MSLNNVIGRPVLGEDFYNRVTEQERVWRRLTHDNILLLAPRRVGKTSLLRRLEQDSSDFSAVYISLGDRGSEIEFIARLHEAIVRHTSSGGTIATALARIGQRLPRLRKLEVANVVSAEFHAEAEADWRALGDELMRTLRESDRRWLLLVDELPLFVLGLLAESRTRARAFLNWLRECRMDPQAGSSTRWLFAGSIGLDTVAARERLGDTIQDLAIETLGPFSAPDADRFLVALAASYRMELAPEVRDHLCARVGWLIPFHLQLLFSTLVDRGVPAPRIVDVEEGYGKLLDPAHKASFDWWVQRLEEELGRVDAGHAHAVLAAAARDEDGVPRSVVDELMLSRGVADEAGRRFLLDALENDGYLVASGTRYVFRSPLLRDYWRARVLA